MAEKNQYKIKEEVVSMAEKNQYKIKEEVHYG